MTSSERTFNEPDDAAGERTTRDTSHVNGYRQRLAELERKARSASRDARHDIVNDLGAARNALQLVDEGADAGERERFEAMARRNIEHAEKLLGSDASAKVSGRDERNDLGGPGERDHGDSAAL